MKESCEDDKTFTSLFSCHYTLKMEVVSYLCSEATDLELSIATAPLSFFFSLNDSWNISIATAFANVAKVVDY